MSGGEHMLARGRQTSPTIGEPVRALDAPDPAPTRSRAVHGCSRLPGRL